MDYYGTEVDELEPVPDSDPDPDAAPPLDPFYGAHGGAKYPTSYETGTGQEERKAAADF